MMDTLVGYFTDMPPLHRSLVLVGGLAFFWALESAAPLVRFDYRKWRHAAVNIVFTLTTVAVNLPLAFLLLVAADWAAARQVGLLYLLPDLPFAVRVLLGLMALDLVAAWLSHWVSHRTRWLWRLHLVHHSDTYVDTTSANRHHPGESVVRFAFTMLAVVLAGAPMWMVVLYQSLSVVLSQFNHANIRLPRAVDRALSWVIVSPDMHKVHHHYVRPWTDSNYGNIFSIWDRAFGTFLSLDREALVYGIDTHMAPDEHSTVGALMTMPFRPAGRR
ncbi:MAG: sterol desaturase family protein [Vicinamibacteria bacterium]